MILPFFSVDGPFQRIITALWPMPKRKMAHDFAHQLYQAPMLTQFVTTARS